MLDNKLLNSNITKTELDEVLGRCYESTEVLAKTLFPRRFDLPFSDKIHRPMFELMDDDSLQLVAIEAPRGVGKTTIASMLYPARAILFRDYRYIIPVSASADAAIEQSENLKQKLTQNENILKLFGNCSSNVWAKQLWESEWPDSDFRTRVRPRGAGQQIRGRLFGDYRPDLIIIDDLEDPDNMDNEEQRRKKKKWFFSDLMNSVDLYGKNKHKWRIIFIGSYLHQDSLIANLIDDPKWNSERLEICDENFKSNWPEAISDKEIKDKYEMRLNQNIPEEFYKEFRSISVSTKDATFKRKYFQYQDESKLKASRFLENIVIVDPAKTAKMESAESAVVGVGVNIKKNNIYFRRVINEKFHPNELYDAIFNVAEYLNAFAIAVETRGLKEFITYPIKNEMVKRGKIYEFIELKPRRGKARGEGKADRIASLVPFYRSRSIYHNKRECAVLEDQLIHYPYSKKKDVMDAASYIVQLLEEGLRYFQPELSGETPGEIEKEYYDLDYDEALEQSEFRII